MALRDEILALIRERPGITDAEIARLIPGPKSRHQQVNSRCRTLVTEGLVRRDKPQAGPIGNYPIAQLDHPEGSPRLRAGEKPPLMGAGHAAGMPPAWGCPAVPPGGTTQAVAPTRLKLEFHWQSAGEIRLVDQTLHFPRLPTNAGIYRIRFPFSRSVYVGEAVNLRRRMQNYRTPGRSQKTSIWVNRLLCDRLGIGDVVILEACTDAMTTWDTVRKAADLKSKVVRVMVEHAAILAERYGNWTPLNKAN